MKNIIKSFLWPILALIAGFSKQSSNEKENNQKTLDKIYKDMGVSPIEKTINLSVWEYEALCTAIHKGHKKYPDKPSHKVIQTKASQLARLMSMMRHDIRDEFDEEMKEHDSVLSITNSIFLRYGIAKGIITKKEIDAFSEMYLTVPAKIFLPGILKILLVLNIPPNQNIIKFIDSQREMILRHNPGLTNDHIDYNIRQIKEYLLDVILNKTTQDQKINFFLKSTVKK